MNIREGISRFLKARESESPFLIGRYSPDLETQVMTYEGFEEAESEGRTWTENGETWSDTRWPRNAGSIPSYTDRELTFSPAARCRHIGTSWWNYVTRRSIAIGLDIDTEEGHAATTTTVDGEKLQELIEKLKALPYVTLLHSKSGKGIHIYTFFDPDDLPVSNNHNEHKKHAVAVLSRISQDLNYDLRQHVDAQGLIFWLWSNDKGPGGFDVIQEQVAFLKPEDLVGHYDIEFQRSTGSVSLQGYTDSGSMVSQDVHGLDTTKYSLDDTHRKILKMLEDEPYDSVWIEQHNMLQTHTYALKSVAEKLEAEGNPIVGRYDTVSGGNKSGSHWQKVNCYITPRPGGAFKVTRFGNGGAEHPLWETIEDKTFCYFNQPLDIKGQLKKFADKVSSKGKMTFVAENFVKAVQALGGEVPEVRAQSSSPIVVDTDTEGVFTASSKDWPNDWTLPFVASRPGLVGSAPVVTNLLEAADQMVRSLISEDGVSLGWALRTDRGWITQVKETWISNALDVAFGDQSIVVKDQCQKSPWTLTSVPFQEEYPGDRVWNKDAVQFKVPPSEEHGPHPHWDMILSHLGRPINMAVRENAWCQKAGIEDGAGFLLAWLACLVRHPFEPLPYLFFYGQQATGKSMFHEMLRVVFTCGIQRANGPLSSRSGFNGELADALLCYVEELDLSKYQGAYNRIKEWTTARDLEIHKKGIDPYNQPNKLHFVQMANCATACPIEEGDKRIIVFEVPPLQNEVGKALLEKRLAEEAPFFLRTLLSVVLPAPYDRFRLPVLTTEAKDVLEVGSRSAIHIHADQKLVPCMGAAAKVSDLYEDYKLFCAERSTQPEPMAIYRAALGPKYTVGKYKDNQNFIANYSIDSCEKPGKKPLVVNDKGRLSTKG